MNQDLKQGSIVTTKRSDGEYVGQVLDMLGDEACLITDAFAVKNNTIVSSEKIGLMIVRLHRVMPADKHLEMLYLLRDRE